MPNILEQISGLCDSRYTSDPRTNQAFSRNDLLEGVQMHSRYVAALKRSFPFRNVREAMRCYSKLAGRKPIFVRQAMRQGRSSFGLGLRVAGR